MARWLLAMLALVLPASIVLTSAQRPALDKLDSVLRARALDPHGHSRVIVHTAGPEFAAGAIQRAGGSAIGHLDLARARVALVPDAGLATLAAQPEVLAVNLDRAVGGSPGLRSEEPRADASWIRDALGIDGTGVAVATIDSGINATHEDLSASRILHWADFVTHQPVPYDDYGHGTHVAGIIAGTGVDAGGTRRGIAPGAGLVVLKALDGTGNGHISDVIAAVDYAVRNRDRFNIRVINLSVAAGVYESARTDPLALAALRAVQAGIVVVAAAGNLGVNAAGEPQYGSITAPGNAPWVLTVGASTATLSPARAGAGVAAFSSRGPSAIDGTPKPDLLAPGVAIESAADSASTLFAVQPRARVWGSAQGPGEPYLRLSGTSMAAPIVAGTVALMLQADPQLTPNAVKAILQFTAKPRRGVDESSQGAGLLNARGAVALARQFASGSDDPAKLEEQAGGTGGWAKQIIWGARHLSGERLPAGAPAWSTDVPWGADSTARGEWITWGALCPPARAGCSPR